MKRTTSAADIKRMAALQQQNKKLRKDLWEETGRSIRAERDRDGWRNVVRRAER